jgi:uncharacterized protein YdbL (DUF1318 family)
MTRRIAIAALLSLSLATLGAARVQAIELDEARQRGLVGERADGLVGAVTASAEAAVLVQAVNDARLDDYRKIAAEQGTSLEAVRAIAGARQIERARANGWYFMDASGRWKKEP